MKFSEEDIEAMTQTHVKIKLNGQPMPERHGEWYDLATAEDVYLQAGEYQRISLGICVEVPKGFYSVMAPRSSTFEKWGVLQANSLGIYERSYCGDGDIWAFPAYAVRETKIPKGTRICQFTLAQEGFPIKFYPVEKMDNPDRGGWGSTGK